MSLESWLEWYEQDWKATCPLKAVIHGIMTLSQKNHGINGIGHPGGHNDTDQFPCLSSL